MLTYFQHPDERGLGAGQASNLCVERYVRPHRSCRQNNTELGPNRARKAADLVGLGARTYGRGKESAEHNLDQATKAKEEIEKGLAEEHKRVEEEVNKCSEAQARMARIKEDKLIDRRSEEPVDVDLTSPDLLEPRQFELDTTKFDESVIVLSDSKAEAEG
ncbi:hypothetical protein RIF29_32951 [Crotalaria pallida]|uniref:Uncharacterized protein n=1 Tax=Crotalaria pallida TaxID=3830 RepID=A0AAN9E7T7_CROPI